MPLPTDPDCPCGSGRSYRACCGPLHDGAPAATAEQLMRSRYAAYAVGRLDYVFRTWHPRTRPDEVESGGPIRWIGLQIVRTEAGDVDDATGVVEFRARSEGVGGTNVMHEVSRFERRAGRWVYVDGDVS